ncbi:hypothetical protein [Streptomyces scopuliridis]|uniref:hypothetical protein n=1 Tax=Streptomyces scopuliridis TaxID=452529 RepID=UPI003689A468
MTRSPAWHARIDADGAVGSGFLISGRTVLTCAHVVAGDRASVVFPGAPGLAPVPARVVVRGHAWAGGDRDPGDLADRRGSKRLRFRLKKMWDVLDRQPGSAVHGISCAGSP